MASDGLIHEVVSTRAEVVGVPPEQADDVPFESVVGDLELGLPPRPGRSAATPSAGA